MPKLTRFSSKLRFAFCVAILVVALFTIAYSIAANGIAGMQPTV